jgi:hypothetical protein
MEPRSFVLVALLALVLGTLIVQLKKNARNPGVAGSRGPNLLFESISGNDSLDPNVLTSEISGPVHTIGTPSQELFSKLIVKGGSDVIYYPMRGTTTG